MAGKPELGTLEFFLLEDMAEVLTFEAWYQDRPDDWVVTLPARYAPLADVIRPGSNFELKVDPRAPRLRVNQRGTNDRIF